MLEAFCAQHGLHLDKNALRQPCRVIRKPGNPNYLMDIHEEGVWHEMEYSEQLPHSVFAAAHYSSPEDSDWVYRVEHLIAHGHEFSSIRNDLGEYLSAWLALVNTWQPATILEQGRRHQNLAKNYNSAPLVPEPES